MGPSMGAQAYQETHRPEEPSAKDTVICKYPTTFFQVLLVQVPFRAERRFAAAWCEWRFLLGLFSVRDQFALQLPISAYRCFLWRATGLLCFQQRKDWTFRSTCGLMDRPGSMSAAARAGEVAQTQTELLWNVPMEGRAALLGATALFCSCPVHLPALLKLYSLSIQFRE